MGLGMSKFRLSHKEVLPNNASYVSNWDIEAKNARDAVEKAKAFLGPNCCDEYILLWWNEWGPPGSPGGWVKTDLQP